MQAGIEAADAGHLVARALSTRADVCLPSRHPITLIAAGKAAVPMAAVFAARSPVPVRNGLVVSTHASASLPPQLELLLAEHPVPGAASERAALRALALAAESDSLVVLLSGGASALLAAPVPGVTLEDKRELTRRLLRSGADITALNCVRKHLSAIKGGRLAVAARGPTLAWAVSDVMGDDLSVIGSGPTVPDPSTFADALNVLDRFGGRSTYPPAAVQRLEVGAAGLAPETPKPGDHVFNATRTELIGTRRDVMDGAREAAMRRGYRVVVIDTPVTGEARRAARRWVEEMVAAAGLRRVPTAVVSTGETTVHVTGAGRGGRNQEFALAAAPVLSELAPPVVFASVGTDGIDGPTDAAGALVDTTTLRRINEEHLSAEQALSENNTYPLFAQLGDLLKTGPTHTNVADLQVLLLGSDDQPIAPERPDRS